MNMKLRPEVDRLLSGVKDGVLLVCDFKTGGGAALMTLGQMTPPQLAYTFGVLQKALDTAGEHVKTELDETSYRMAFAMGQRLAAHNLKSESRISEQPAPEAP
jgi:hypothetical protein